MCFIAQMFLSSDRDSSRAVALLMSLNLSVGGTAIHSQKRHRLVASCQFYRVVAICQQVGTSLSI